MSQLPISLQVMIKGLYDTTVEFFALRSPTTPLAGQPSGSNSSNLRSLTPVPDPIGRLTRECASLREQLDTADLHRDSDAPHMRRGLENITNQLARSRAEVAKLEERCRMLENALRGTRETLQAREVELERMKKVRNVNLVDEMQDDGQAGQSGSEGSVQMGNRTAGPPTMLSEEQRAQLRSNEIYMTRTDSWSGAQVMQAVHDLNSEIIQFAASATELCTFDSNNPSSPQAMQDTAARLGSNLAGLLSARERNSQDPTCVGLALQVALTTCIARAMSGFALGLPSKSDVILSQVYSHIFVAEPQPTSSRWRALAHRHLTSLYPGLPAYAAEELKETICRWTSDILVAACASTSRGWIRETFGDQIGRMVKAVAEVARMTREEIMSTNFDVILVEPQNSFDERTMVDVFGEYGISESHGGVLGTTELGLRRMTRKGGSGKDGTVEQQLLVKPKVILDTVGTAFI